MINLGKPLKSFGTASLNIDWPMNTATHKWLLYLMKITTTGTDNIPCTPNKVNPLSLSQVSHSSDYFFKGDTAINHTLPSHCMEVVGYRRYFKVQKDVVKGPVFYYLSNMLSQVSEFPQNAPYLAENAFF